MVMVNILSANPVDKILLHTVFLLNACTECLKKWYLVEKMVIATVKLIQNAKNEVFWKIQDIVKLRQGSARDGPQGKRPQSLKPCLELTSKFTLH